MLAYDWKDSVFVCAAKEAILTLEEAGFDVAFCLGERQPFFQSLERKIA